MHNVQRQHKLPSERRRALSFWLAGVRLVLSVELLVVALGCESSPPIYPVSGQVLIDGVPATTGSIRFMPDDGRPATSTIGRDGKFTLVSQAVSGQHEGVKPGRYRVAVTSNESIDAETVRWLVPAKYADFRTSGLEVDVDKPVADLKIDVSWDGVEREDADSSQGEVASSDMNDVQEPSPERKPSSGSQ